MPSSIKDIEPAQRAKKLQLLALKLGDEVWLVASCLKYLKASSQVLFRWSSHLESLFAY